jgi:hypothetical protein
LIGEAENERMHLMTFIKIPPFGDFQGSCRVRLSRRF